MKFQIELDEQTAACVWANQNPNRNRPDVPPPLSLAQCVEVLAREDARVYVRDCGPVDFAVKEFRKHLRKQK